MSITIDRLEMFVVDLPMVKPFTTSFGTVASRKLVLVKLIDKDGVVGWGEAAPTEHPVYSPDFPESIVAVIQHTIAPALQRYGQFNTPEELDDYLGFIRGHYFAKAAMSMAAYDIESQKQKMTLMSYLGGCDGEISLSRTISITPDIGNMLAVAAQMVDEGFEDLKLKIAPHVDINHTTALRHHYPEVRLMVDANAGYIWSDETMRLFCLLDDLNLFCIEQPLDWNDLYDHARLQKLIKTPIALDESVDCLHAFEEALALESCRLINIKVARVGSLTAAKRVLDRAKAHKIGAWVGGMIEGPVGLAAVMAYSTLDGLTLPADYIDPHYLIKDYEKYFLSPPYTLSGGQLKANFTKPGLGLDIDFKRLGSHTTHHLTIDKV